jgi:hypothetical protein
VLLALVILQSIQLELVQVQELPQIRVV